MQALDQCQCFEIKRMDMLEALRALNGLFDRFWQRLSCDAFLNSLSF